MANELFPSKCSALKSYLILSISIESSFFRLTPIPVIEFNCLLELSSCPCEKIR